MKKCPEIQSKTATNPAISQCKNPSHSRLLAKLLNFDPVEMKCIELAAEYDGKSVEEFCRKMIWTSVEGLSEYVSTNDRCGKQYGFKLTRYDKAFASRFCPLVEGGKGRQ